MLLRLTQTVAEGRGDKKGAGERIVVCGGLVLCPSGCGRGLKSLVHLLSPSQSNQSCGLETTVSLR